MKIEKLVSEIIQRSIDQWRIIGCQSASKENVIYSRWHILNVSCETDAHGSHSPLDR